MISNKVKNENSKQPSQNYQQHYKRRLVFKHAIYSGYACSIYHWPLYKGPHSIQLAAVKFRIPPHEIALKPIETKASSAGGIAKEAEITVRMWVTPMIYVAFLLLAAFFATISTGIIYHLRKIFAAIKQKQPFRADVVKSLKIIALLLTLITPLHLLYGGISYYVLTHTIADFNKQFMMVWSENFIGPILGAVIYIIADILKYGIELKKENEEFV